VRMVRDESRRAQAEPDVEEPVTAGDNGVRDDA
jgi:hypothetical protein